MKSCVFVSQFSRLASLRAGNLGRLLTVEECGRGRDMVFQFASPMTKILTISNLKMKVTSA